MQNIIKLDVDIKKSMFRDFLLSRNPSEKFVRTYFVYLRSSIVITECQEVSSMSDVFAVQDRTELEQIYSLVKKNEKNIASHNVYSGAISAYLKFLDGRKLRPMINQDAEIIVK